MPSPDTWAIQLLGGATLQRSDGLVVNLERKMAAAFAYLLLEGPTYRARLADLLWPDSPEATGKNNLSQLIRKTRLTTGLDLLSGNPLHLQEVNADLSRARDLYAQGQAGDLISLDAELLPGLLYDDCPDLDEWITAAREEVRMWFLQALHTEAARLETAGDLTRAQAHVQRLLNLEPHSEDATRLLMRVQYAQGDRGGALRTYQRFTDLLRSDLGVEPLSPTRQLAQEIDRGTAVVTLPAREKVELPLAVLRPPRLVGREREWAQMEEAYARGQWVFVGGPPGSGKTRLVLDFAASKGPYLLFPGRPGDRTQPWSTTARMYRTSLIERPQLELPDWVRRELSRIVPELARPGEELPPIQNDEGLMRLREACRIFSVANHEGTVSSVSDDWQFYDEHTNRNGVYMFGTAARLGQPGALPPLLVTYRTGELGPDSQEILDQAVQSGMAVHIMLDALPDDGMQQLMDDVGVPADPHTRQRLLDHTAGHPVFLLETVKHLLETGQLTQGLPDRLPLPDRVKEMIERRLLNLSAPALQAARAAAVLQRDFTPDLVADLLNAPVLELLESWSELEEAQIVRGNGFWHDLMSESIAAQTPPSIRVLLHRNAARVLERAGADPLRVAEHWLSGENPQAAAPYLQRAQQVARSEFRLDDVRAVQERLDAIQASVGPLEEAAQANRLPGSLPQAVTSFHGREAERAELCAALRDGARLITLTGPGGVGKTRLALEVARALSAAGGLEASFMSLEDLTDPALLPRTLARGLGVPDEDPRDPLDAARSVLNERRALLVLDNLEQIVGAAPVLAHLLQSTPGLQLLVTSRIPLSLSYEQVFQLWPFALPGGLDLHRLEENPAASLFVSRARAAQPTFQLTAENAGTVQAILRQLDGLPLAIELAAPRLRMMPPATLLQRLRDALGALRQGPRDLPVRHQTLRATIEWSVQLLSEAERVLLRRLAVFAGGWTLDAAEVVADPDGSLDVLERLGGLIDHSLVRWTDAGGEDVRYGMLSTVRAFALEALEAAGEGPATRLRLAQSVTDLMTSASADLRTARRAQAIRDVEAEKANVLQAFDILLQEGQLDRAVTLASILAQMWWVSRALLPDRGVLRQLADHPGLGDLSASAQAHARFAVAAHAFWSGEHASAARLFDQAAELFGAAGDELGAVQCGNYRILLLVTAGQLDAAEALAGETLARGEPLHDPVLEAQTIQALLHIPQARGDAASIQRWAERLQVVAQSEGDLVNLMHAAWYRSLAARLNRQFHEAAGHLSRSQEHALALRSPSGLLSSLSTWAQLALDTLNDRQAALILGVAQRQEMDHLLPTWSSAARALRALRAAAPRLEETYPDRVAEGRALDLPQALDLLARTAALEATR